MQPERHCRFSPRVRRSAWRGGFTLIELLVVIAVIGILAALLLPVLAKGKLRAQGIQCMSNHRQLCLAWRMYSEDNAEKLVLASEMPGIPSSYDEAWITGTLDFNPNNPVNWDPSYTIEKSPLWQYCGHNLGIWKCPADPSFVVVNGEPKPRVRSMSMNVYLGGWGGTDGNWGWSANWKFYRKQSELSNPGPSTIFVFLDMRPDSIDMGNFATDMDGWPDKSANYGFFDLPGWWHHLACGFSFADGHSEIRRWRDSRTMPRIVPQGFVNDWLSTPDNVDVAWLQERSTRPIQ